MRLSTTSLPPSYWLLFPLLLIGCGVGSSDDSNTEVHYDLNGGDGEAPASQTYNEGDAVTITDHEPSKDGYTFLGWADRSSAINAQYSSGDTSTFTIGNEDITLHAVWDANPDIDKRTVRYHLNGGSGVSIAVH